METKKTKASPKAATPKVASSKSQSAALGKDNKTVEVYLLGANISYLQRYQKANNLSSLSQALNDILDALRKVDK